MRKKMFADLQPQQLVMSKVINLGKTKYMLSTWTLFVWKL